MTRKISFGVVAILLFISIVASSLVTLLFVFNAYDNLLVDLPQRAEQYKKLSEIDELIRSEYYGKFDSDSVDDSLASGLLYSLDDIYSYYVSEEDYEEYRNLISGNAYGIGVNVYFDNSLSHLVVSYVYENSPAHSAGIEINDIITSVNGKSVTEDNQSAVISLLCESVRKKVSFTVVDAVSGNSASYELTSGYNLESCYYSVNKTVGYLRLTGLYEKTVDDFAVALNSFKEDKVSSVILDLRNCSGSDFDVAAKIIDLIVPVGSEGSGAIYSAKNSAGETIIQFPSDANAVNMTFAVLINNRTEGAAELIACDLRDFGKGYLFGEKTAGHGTMQKVFDIQDSGYVILTVAEVYPYISSSFNETGVAPDVEILTTESFKNQIGVTDLKDDEQYQKAYAYLSGN